MESDPKSESSSYWERIDRLLESALELEPGRRTSFLRETCGNDAALLREVESLLLSHEEAGSFIERPALGGALKRVAAEDAASRVGQRIGPYELKSFLASGGMGEVYRATDVRLNRTVAIKFLPAHLSGSPELRRRLEREARAVSSLNHPHICTLYDIGREDGSDFLVMEYLEGESLADRLKKGALPLEQALQHGVELAGALSAAHRQGVTHRDVKPGNVMLVKTGIKLMDFGLAKLSRSGGSGLSTASPGPGQTGDDPRTAEGTILGTLQYMAPEQLEGAEVSAQTDIFAFGAVLYEMVTGRRAFEGESQASLIASIMSSNPPPVSMVRPAVPDALDHVIRRCLARDPEERWQNAYDLKRELQWIVGNIAKPSSVSPLAAPSNRRVWIGAAIGTAAGLAAGITIWPISTPPAERRKNDLILPEGWALAPVARYLGPAVSPDGSRIVLAATRSGETLLYWCSWTNPDWNPIPGTEGGQSPFWNPNNEEIGFFADGQLKTASLSGGKPLTMCDVSELSGLPGQGGAWNSSGSIIFAGGARQPLFRVRVRDRAKMELTTLDPSIPEGRHCWPCFLPDQTHFLYLAYSREKDRGLVYAGSLDSPRRKQVLSFQHDSGVAYAAGHILYVKEGRLYAQPFDAVALKTEGDPFVVDDGPVMVTEFRACFSAANNGNLVFYGLDKSRLVRLDREDGAKKDVQGIGVDRFRTLRLSSDGQKLFYATNADWGDKSHRWLQILDLKSSKREHFSGRGTLRAFVFSNDSRQAFFSGSLGAERQNNQRMVYRTTLTPGNKVELVLAEGAELTVFDVSYNGKFLLLLKRERRGEKSHLCYYELPDKEVAGATVPFGVEPPFTSKEGRFSPRGLKNLWVAYVSDEEGEGEQVYVRPFPATPPHRIRISEKGGNWPVWTKGGKEIVFLSPDNVLHAVSLEETGSGLKKRGIGPILALPPDWSIGRGSRGDHAKHDITPDGNIIYAIENLPTPISTLENWNIKAKT
jgi:serine/threonine protein kinase/Tol biopolymer transport system component